MVELESGRSSMGGQEGGILPANHHLPSLDHHLGHLCLSFYAEQCKYVVSSRGNILSQFQFCFLALKFRSSREMSQEWSGWRSMSGHWRGMPRHEWPGRQDALNCRHPVLCVSDRDPRWNLDPGPARNPSRVTAPLD